MQFHRDSNDSINIIRAFGTDGIRVGERTLAPPCIIGVSIVIEHWETAGVTGLTPDHLAPIIELQPELIILGSGSILQFPPGEVTRAVNRNGIGFEVMDTAAGCRTYNVLAHEGRNVALALLPDTQTPPA